MATYDSVILSDRPSNYWRLGETSGTTAVDLVGGANGAISGGVTLNQPGPGSGNVAMGFDGSTGLVQTTASVNLPALCTVEAWILTGAATGIHTIFSDRAGGTGDTLLVGIDTNRLAVYFGGGVFGSRAIADGAWHHIACVFTGTTVTFYVDGVFDGTQPWVRTQAFGPAAIGRDGGGLVWSGALDEVAIYPYVLTPAQIRAHYAAAPLRVPYAPGSYPALVLADGARNYWRLGEATGTSAVDVVSGVNGTISGGVTLGQAGALGDGDKAMGFNGTTGKIVTASNVTLPLECTVEAWVNTSVDAITIFAQRPGTGNSFVLYCSGGKRLVLVVDGIGTGPTGTRVIGDGMWHHIVCRFLTTGSEFYVDGVLDPVSAGAAVVRTVQSVAPCSIGADNPAAFFFNGQLDDVALYPLALSAAQIAAHYAARTLPYVPGTYPARVIASGPSNYWRLGESSGATAVDLVGGANGTISGGVTLGQKGALSEPDTAMGFNGVDGKIVTAANVTIPVVATFECWVKADPSVTGDKPFFSTRATGYVYVGLLGGVIRYYNGLWGGVPGVLNMDGQWHHFAIVNDGVNALFYEDGVFAVSRVMTVGTPTSAPAQFGYDPTLAFFPGSVDDVAIYPRLLSASEILAHYNAKLADMWDPRLYPPTSPPTTGPVAYPAVTSPYPQPPGTPEYAPRPAPTLATLTPSSVSVGASDGFLEMTLTGTGFTNASRVTFAGILDHPRVDDTITYVNPTTLLMTLDVRTPPATLPPATYQLGIVNQDSQASATLPLTVSA